jgi:hypothetical protein
MIFRKLCHLILDIFTSRLRLRERTLTFIRPLLPFGRALLCLCQAAFEYLATVAHAAELLQLRFIRLGLRDKRGEVLELFSGAPEILPVGLLRQQGVVLGSKDTERFNSCFLVT